MTSCSVNSTAYAALDGITAQDFLENPELKVYVEDALRLVLVARPERPLDIINAYLQSVLDQENVVGREFAYVNATMRNRQAFVRAVHNVFVDPGNRVAVDNGGCLLSKGCGFEQMDVVHLLGLVCPDFPEEIVARVARILSEGSGHVRGSDRCPRSTHSPPGEMCPPAVPSVTSPDSVASVSAATTAIPGTIGGSHIRRSGSPPCATSSDLAAAEGLKQIEFVKALPFEVFLRACNIFFCFQEFFEDVRALFSSMAFMVDGAGKHVAGRNGVRDTGDSNNTGARVTVREVNLRILLDQLQVMKAEPRNQLRYLDIASTEAAVRRGGLGERATLPAFLACLLLHSNEVASSLLEKPTVDGYAARLEASPALWAHHSGSIDESSITSPKAASGDGADVVAEATG
ncbi:unnamed protein product [Scytosiphon promiscuus]